MITLAIMIFLSRAGRYIDSDTMIVLPLMELCIVAIIAMPFFHKEEWKGIKGYFGFLKSKFF